jgi:hypothetical protein
VNVENDVLVVLRRTHPRKRRVSPTRAVKLQAAETTLEIACVSEGERLGDFDDQGALDELDVFGLEFGVLETGCGARNLS